MLTIKEATGNFFDKALVTDAVDKASIQVLSKFGAFVRTRSKRSIRRRKKASSPGQPPSSHVGLLKDLIFFSYDPEARAVVIGPTLSNRPSGAPEILEYSGIARGENRHGPFEVRIAARPFMQPAFEAELPGLPAMWKDSVR